jgi:hypothetical protein
MERKPLGIGRINLKNSEALKPVEDVKLASNVSFRLMGMLDGKIKTKTRAFLAKSG